MHIVVRTRRVLAVHPWIHWAVCVGLAVAAAFATHGYIARLDAERRSWGTTHEVWVSADNIAAGEPIRATATEVPVALVPPAAVTLVRTRFRGERDAALVPTMFRPAPVPVAVSVPEVAVIVPVLLVAERAI